MLHYIFSICYYIISCYIIIGLQGVRLDLKTLALGDLGAALRHGALRGPRELQVVAAEGEAADLRAVLVVADADDGVPRLLDHLDERRVAAAVARAHAVDLVHDDDGLRGRLALLGTGFMGT